MLEIGIQVMGGWSKYVAVGVRVQGERRLLASLFRPSLSSATVGLGPVARLSQLMLLFASSRCPHPTGSR